MSEPQKPVRERYSRVEQKLQDLLRRTREAQGLAGRITGTSEETASLFSAGTTPAVRLTRFSR
jgi:hypothetical protein